MLLLNRMKKIFIIFGFILSLFFARYTNAAYLYLVPSSGEVNIGDTFNIVVKADTQGTDVNVAEATISFPSDILSVDKVNPGATFKLQTPESLHKTQNKIFFSAGIPSPGYNGASGILGNITFRAIARGTAHIDISEGKLLVNDGNASDALDNKLGSVIKIKPAPIVEDTQNIDKQEVIVTYTKQDTVPDTLQFNSIAVESQSSIIPSSNTITLKFTLQDFIYTISISLTIIILLIITIIYLSIRLIHLRRQMEKPKI